MTLEDNNILPQSAEKSNVVISPWDSVRSEITRLTSTDISLLTKEDAIAMGKANRSLEAVQKWARDSKKQFEIQNEIAINRLWLNRKQGEWINENIPEDGAKGIGKSANEMGSTTLAQIGIDYHDSPKFRALAKLTFDRFQKYINDAKINQVEVTTSEAYRLYKIPHVANNSGNNEWYTPPNYIESARLTMGSIDTDPASSKKANEIIKAKLFFTIENDGRIQKWTGNIWMNPPYSQPLITEFCNLLVDKYEQKEISQACVLVNNATETNFYQNMLNSCQAVCFIKGRVKFIDENGMESGAPLQGQTILYFGNNKDKFTIYFGNFGVIFYA